MKCTSLFFLGGGGGGGGGGGQLLPISWKSFSSFMCLFCLEILNILWNCIFYNLNYRKLLLKMMFMLQTILVISLKVHQNSDPFVLWYFRIHRKIEWLYNQGS